LWLFGIQVDDSEDALEQLPTATEAPIVTVTPHNALYIIFTSGSTGRGKDFQHADVECVGRHLQHPAGGEDLAGLYVLCPHCQLPPDLLDIHDALFGASG
jgi:non-ribosomal peptide synthetase component F